jgi:hypothetical protein
LSFRAKRGISLWKQRTSEIPRFARNDRVGFFSILLGGCQFGRALGNYWDLLVKASVEAAREALANLRPALLRYLTVPVPHVSHNRRSLLEDGRVVMSRNPTIPVVKVGPTWDRLLLVRFDN